MTESAHHQIKARRDWRKYRHQNIITWKCTDDSGNETNSTDKQFFSFRLTLMAPFSLSIWLLCMQTTMTLICRHLFDLKLIDRQMCRVLRRRWSLITTLEMTKNGLKTILVDDWTRENLHHAKCHIWIAQKLPQGHEQKAFIYLFLSANKFERKSWRKNADDNDDVVCIWLTEVDSQSTDSRFIVSVTGTKMNEWMRCRLLGLLLTTNDDERRQPNKTRITRETSGKKNCECETKAHTADAEQKQNSRLKTDWKKHHKYNQTKQRKNKRARARKEKQDWWRVLSTRWNQSNRR